MSAVSAQPTDRRAEGNVATGTGALAERWEKLSARLPAEVRARVIAEARVIHLPGDVPPWTDTGFADIAVEGAGRTTEVIGR